MATSQGPTISPPPADKVRRRRTRMTYTPALECNEDISRELARRRTAAAADFDDDRHHHNDDDDMTAQEMEFSRTGI